MDCNTDTDNRNDMISQMESRGWEYIPDEEGSEDIRWRSTLEEDGGKVMRLGNWEEVRIYVENTEPVAVSNYSVKGLQQDILTLEAGHHTPVYVQVGKSGVPLPIEHVMCDIINGKRSLVMVARGKRYWDA